MKKYRKLVLLTILFLTVGFAAVSTTLIINGASIIGTNEEDFDVYFSKALLDGKNISKEVISEDRLSISYKTNTLIYKDETSVLEYEVTNNSTQYDALVSIECIPSNIEGISITNSIESEIISAQSRKTGKLIVTLNENVLEEKEIEFKCNIAIDAVERISVGKEFCSSESQSAPIITGGVDTWTYENIVISLEEEGSAVSGVKEYEYYITENEEVPTSETEATGTTDNEITISESGIKYIYYRTVSNSGCKSEWSNVQKIMIDKTEPTLTLNANIPSSITKGESYNIVSSYTTSEYSGGTLICESDKEGVITNTSELTTIGTHIISCIVKNNVGKSISKSVQTTITYAAYTIKNLVTNGSFESSSSGWNSMGGTIVSSNAYTGSKSLYINDTSTTNSYWNNHDLTNISKNNLIFMSVMVKKISGTNAGSYKLTKDGTTVSDTFFRITGVVNVYTRYTYIAKLSGTENLIQLGSSLANKTKAYYDDVLVVNLTKAFGSGNEPSLEWCTKHINYFNGTRTVYK